MATDGPSDDVVRLAHAVTPAQAHIWQQRLQEEGIECHVVGDYLDAGLGDIPGMQSEVWVHRGDFARAEEVLRRIQETATEGAAEEEDDEAE